MTPDQYWLTAFAAFTGVAVFTVLAASGAYAIALLDRKRAKRKADKPVPKRATGEHPIPFDHPDDAPEYHEPFGVKITHPKGDGVPLFEPSYEFTEREAADAQNRHALRAEPAGLLCEAPEIEGVTLFAYLKHHAPSRVPVAQWDSDHMGVWASFVETFYTAAGGDQRIAHKFEGANMVDLKRHFTRFLVELTAKGLTVGRADEIGRAHHYLGITEAEYDAVTGHFVQTLQQFLSPRAFEHVLPQLTPAVGALRTRIVFPVRSMGGAR